MNKVIRSQVADFKKKESDLLVELIRDPNNAEIKTRMGQLMLAKKAWLETIGGALGKLTPEDRKRLVEMVKEAEQSITRAARINANLVIFINDSIANNSASTRRYQVIVEDNSQLEALAEDSACRKVRDLEKFNKKRNGKSFLNVSMCKFKKSKTQENANEQQGPSVQ